MTLDGSSGFVVPSQPSCDRIGLFAPKGVLCVVLVRVRRQPSPHPQRRRGARLKPPNNQLMHKSNRLALFKVSMLG